MARCVRRSAAALRGRLTTAVELAELAVRLAFDDADAIRRAPHGYLALAYLHADRPDLGLKAVGEGQAIAESLGAAGVLGLFGDAAMVCYYYAGQWDDALVEAETASARSDENGLALATIQTGVLSGLIALHQGDVPRATALAAAQWARLDAGANNVGMLFLAQLEVLLAEQRGDLGGAAFWLRLVPDQARASGATGLLPTIGPDLVRILLAVGERDEAVAVIDELAVLDHDEASDVQRSLLLRMRGLIDGDPEPILAALELLRPGMRPLDFVLASDEAAALLAARGAAGDAAALLEQGLRIADDIGAGLHVPRLTAALRALGRRPGAPARRARPVQGWDALTATEVKVARLVADGLANADIAACLYISKRTVETHVSHALAKLRVTGRAALAAEATRQPRLV